MNRWALMSGNTVANVVEQDGAPVIDGQWFDVTGLAVGPGWRRVGADWQSPQAAVPVSISNAQARLMLLSIGKLADVDTLIAAMPEPDKSQASIEWNYSTEIHRAHSLVQSIGVALGLSDAQLDAMFVAAAAL